jgi:hypothetical protein
VRPRFFGVVFILSSALFATTLALWARSYQNDDRFSLLLHGDRYTLTSAAGRVGVNGPPPEATDPQVRRAAREVVAAMRNDQVYWTAEFRKGDRYGPACVIVNPAEPLLHTPTDQVDSQFAPDDVARPLLDALEDPDRFVSAHALLFRRRTPGARQPGFQLPSNAVPGPGVLDNESCPHGNHHREPWVELDHGGLPVTLRRWMEGDRAPVMGLDIDCHPMVGDPDATRFVAVRDAWHRRLDVQVASVPHWELAAGTGVLPLVWLGRSVRRGLARRAFRRLGRCRACGYDLRASPGRCPECGAVPPPWVRPAGSRAAGYSTSEMPPAPDSRARS